MNGKDSLCLVATKKLTWKNVLEKYSTIYHKKSDHLEIRRMGTGKQLIIQFQEISFKY